MKKIKVVPVIALLLAALALLSACRPNSPEIGTWKTTIPLTQSTVDPSSQEAQLQSIYTTILTGGYGVDLTVQFKRNGTFKMNFDTENLKKAIKNSAGSVLSLAFSLIGLNFDLSGIVENVIDGVFNQAMGNIEMRTSGTYRKEGDLLICNEEEELRFKLDGEKLLILDGTGKTAFTLTKD